MRPLRLELEGFGAFLERAAVDFSDVELFAITGPTGSGKTTLLDAMTFALYGETPRMGRKGLKALLNPGARKASVQLAFRLGDEVWRVTRVIAGKTEARLERQVGSEWQLSAASEKVRTLNEAVEKLLGLDYDAFTRAIMLPQGQFDAFLKGDSRERRELLFSLYGLGGLAAMRERASEILSELREKLAAARQRMEVYGEADEEAVAAARAELEELAGQQRELELAIARLEKEVAGLDELAELWEERRRLEGRRAALEADAGRIEEVRGWLERARAAAKALPELERLERLRAELRAQERKVEKREDAYAAAQKAWEKANETFDPDRLEVLRQQVATLPLLEARARTLRALGGADGEGPAEPYDEQLYRELEGRFRELETAQRAREEARRLEERAGRLEEDLRRNEKRERELEREMAELERRGKEEAARVEELERRLEEERRRAELAAYRHLLRPGEPCPLCLQPVEKPPQAKESPLAALEAELRRKREGLERLRDSYKEKKAELKSLKDERKRLEKQLAELREDIERIRGKEPGFDPEEAGRVAARLAALRRGLAADIAGKTGGREPGEYARELRRELEELERRGRKLEELKRTAEEARAALNSERARLEGLAQTLEPLEKSVAALLAELGFAAAGEVREAVRDPREIERLEEELRAWSEERDYVGKRLAELAARLEGRPRLDAAELAEKKRHLAAQKERHAELAGRRGRLEERLGRLQADLEKKRQAEKEAAGLVREVGVWEQLAEDLKGHKFPDYLLERLQLDMLARASELLFTLSQQRYRFRLLEGVYHVEDTWTGSVRPAKTLSGGETFLASLSLALSLSEHLSRGRLGALFLDEGFGTLDAEALELAAEVLETLPTQGRMVGVVTHVSELAQRLPARLVVEKSPQGSRVRWEE
ncbi:AAA family ATPase [Oceanithermus sp.]